MKKSCETQLVHIIDNIAIDLDNGREIDTLYLVFSKAFDKSSSQKDSCSNYLTMVLLDWITDFPEGRIQSVVIGDYSSNPYRVLSGVPQGTVLTPFLLICHVHNLITLVNSKIRLYANDIDTYERP